jgi:putative ABC transport system permease protein
MDAFLKSLALGVRLLRRNPGFAAVVLGTLAVAIGATLTTISIVDAWLFRPLAFPRPDRLVVAFGATRDRPREPAVWLPYRAYLGWKQQSRSFDGVSGAFMRDGALIRDGRSETVLGLSVTPDFFQTLGVRPLLGRPLIDADAVGPRALVLTYGFWQRHFGGAPSAVGAAVTLSGRPYRVVGVMPAAFDFRVLDMRFEFVTAIQAGEPGYDAAGLGPVTIVARLRDSATLDAATAEAARITRDIEAGYQPNFNDFVVNLTPLQEDNARSVRATLLTVSVGVVALLIIAATNVGTLLLGRGLARAREAAIRVAVGAGPLRLAAQFLTESLVIAMLGTAAGLVLAAVAIRLFVAWNPLGALPANAIQVDLRVIAAAVLIAPLTALICGTVPALRASAALPADALRSATHGSTAPARRAQTAMLAAQIAASLVLLVATSLLVRTLMKLNAEPLGFTASHLMVAPVVLPNDVFDSSEKRNLYYRQLAERVRTIPGVTAIAASTSRPLVGGPPTTVNTTAADDPKAPRISTQDITGDFFSTLQTPLRTGRAFDGRDSATGEPVAILNARAAEQLFGGESAAIGHRVRLGDGPWREVVGVVANVRSTFFNTLEWLTTPIVYRPAAQAFAGSLDPAATSFAFQLHVRSDRQVTLAELRDAVIAVDPRAAVGELSPVPLLIDEATRQASFRTTLLFWFSAASLLLAAIGVYGVVAQGVTQRLRDIAIRLAIGAQPGRVMRDVARHALLAGAAGLLVGSVAIALAARWLQAVLYGVQPTDAASFAAAAAVLLAVTLGAALIPARRASRVQPVTILRGD